MRQYRTNGKVERKKNKIWRERERKREKRALRETPNTCLTLFMYVVSDWTLILEREREKDREKEREKDRERKRERKHSLKFYLKIIHLLQAYPNNSWKCGVCTRILFNFFFLRTYESNFVRYCFISSIAFNSFNL